MELREPFRSLLQKFVRPAAPGAGSSDASVEAVAHAAPLAGNVEGLVR
jgi:hypothetical protein